MPDHYTREEFERLREPWDAKAKALFEERMSSGYRAPLQHFTEAEAMVLGRLLEVLIPQSEGIDLVAFVDQMGNSAMGRGDRPPGLPDPIDLMRLGARGLEEAASALHGRPFGELSQEQIEALIPMLQDDQVPGEAWREAPAKMFLQRLYSRALHGYLAHPLVWMRMGFMGPSFPEGYAWTGRAQVAARHERHAGWERL